MATLKINRGTTYPITVNYQGVDETGATVARTLVGATVRFTVKSAEYSTDATDTDALIAKSVTNGTSGGVATITIEPADTATLTPATGKNAYYYDIKVEEADGSIYKIDEGRVALDGSPTNRLA